MDPMGLFSWLHPKPKKPVVSHNVDPEQLARRLTSGISQSFALIEAGQGHILQEMGYTAAGRMQLAMTIAEGFYRSGVKDVPPGELQKYMSLAEVESIVYNLLCGDDPERAARQALVRLLQRPEFRRLKEERKNFLEQERIAHEQTHGPKRRASLIRLTPSSGRPGQTRGAGGGDTPITGKNGDVPAVQPGDRRTGRTASGGRPARRAHAGRDPGTVYTLPARMGDRHP